VTAEAEPAARREPISPAAQTAPMAVKGAVFWDFRRMGELGVSTGVSPA
jgi:hypothetical protein